MPPTSFTAPRAPPSSALSSQRPCSGRGSHSPEQPAVPHQAHPSATKAPSQDTFSSWSAGVNSKETHGPRGTSPNPGACPWQPEVGSGSRATRVPGPDPGSPHHPASPRCRVELPSSAQLEPLSPGQASSEEARRVEPTQTGCSVVGSPAAHSALLAPASTPGPHPGQWHSRHWPGSLTAHTGVGLTQPGQDHLPLPNSRKEQGGDRASPTRGHYQTVSPPAPS